jgi:F-type H+-transporting ATPase subunit delta
MKNTRIYKTYAKIFFNYAKEQKALDKVLEELSAIVQVFSANKKLTRFFTSSIYSFDEKSKILALCKFSDISTHFLHVLLNNNKASYLPDIYNEILTLKTSDEGMTRATLISASNMNNKEIAICKEILEKKLQKKFAIDYEIDPSLIGGVVLKFGTMMYDTSIRSALQRLKEIRV